MTFWIRHALLLIGCVVFPFLAGLYLDTMSELSRARQAGAVAAKAAQKNLEAQLTLGSHKTVSSAMSLAQRITDRDLAGEGNQSKERKEAAITALAELLQTGTPNGGFAWYVDEAGVIAASNAGRGKSDLSRRIGSHPLFVETQQGYALDGLWRDNGAINVIGAAPVTVRGQAMGAVFVAMPIDRSMLDAAAKLLDAEVTLVADGKVEATTLEPTLADTLNQATGDSPDAVGGGALSKPMRHEWLPVLPLFVKADLEGSAYESVAFSAPGLEHVKWMVTARVGDRLTDLPKRQESVLGGMIAIVMIAVLIGLINHRTFVRPIDRITDHLSEIQFGRGELELPESATPVTFRRLVKLINMTVQKIPSRGFVRSGDGLTSELPRMSDMGSEMPQMQAIAPSSSPIPTGDLKLDALGSSQTALNPALQAPAGFGQPAFMSSPQGNGDYDSAFADAMSSIQKQDEPEPNAIAAAIASLENNSSSQRPRASAMGASASDMKPSSKAGLRSAADIRGVASNAMANPVTPAGVGTPAITMGAPVMGTPAPEMMAQASRPMSTARGGGSFDLGGALGTSAGLGTGAAVVDHATFDDDAAGGFSPERTVVAPVTDELLRRSAAREDTNLGYAMPSAMPGGEMTMVANVSPGLLAQTMAPSEDLGQIDLSGLDAADHAHFKETYERFIEMRKRCGEPTGDLAFDRFLQKLAKNRDSLIRKYNCRTVRFQVYEKDGKAALKATPVRAR